jgi:hypothetical protein
MKTSLRQILQAAGLAGALLMPVYAAVAEETNLWSFDVTPYLWVASVDVDTGRPPSTPPAVDRFDTKISAGASYRITKWCSATAGYRYLHEEYSRDRFTSNLDAHGVLVGVGFHF